MWGRRISQLPPEQRLAAGAEAERQVLGQMRPETAAAMAALQKAGN